MIVQCAKCGTKFRLDETKIGQLGAKVRCSKCQHSFVVKRPPSVDAPSGVNPTAAPPRVGEAERPPPRGRQAGATGPGAGFAIDEPISDLNPAPGLDSAGVLPRPGPVAPALPALPDDPSAAGPMPPVGGPELPALPGVSDLPELPTETKDPIHEVQTAVYVIPEAIRAASEVRQEPAAGGSSPVAPGLSAEDIAAVDLDDSTGVVPPDVLAQAKAAAAAGSPDDIPSADADLIDDDEVTLVSDSNSPSDPAGGLDGLPGDPFADSGDSLAPGGGDAFSGEGALGRIQPAVLGSDAPPVTEASPAGSPLDPAPPAPSAPAAGPTEEETEERGGWSLGVKLVTTAVGVAILGVGVLFWMGGGRLDLARVGLGKGDKAAPHYKGVHPVAMRSVLYPTRAGEQVLVFVGRAENRADEKRENVAAVAELRNRRGELVASARAPVGLALSPAYVADLTDRKSLADAYASLARVRGEPTLASKAVVPFTVVLLQPPNGLADLEHSVRLIEGEPVVTREPPPPPPPPPEPTEEEVEQDDESDERKGKRKRKGKRRRRKAKAKAKAAEE